jgi:hypothetical protein
MRSLLLLGLCFCLSGCFIVRETQPVKMTVIPLPEKPELTGDPEKDVPILGEHAMRLRQLIIRYNELAAEHNAKF